MNLFESIFINAVFILFPLFCYFLFVAHQRSCGKKTSNILLDLAIYTSFYLILKYEANTGFSIMLITLPLLIAYLKNKAITALIMSLIIGIYYGQILDFNIILLFIEFLSYFVIFLILNKKKTFVPSFLNGFIIIKIISIFFEINNPIIKNVGLICLIVWSLVYCFMVYFVCYLIKKAEESSKLKMTIKELEKQKQIRDSLFKITHEIKNPLAVCKGYLDMLDLSDQNKVNKYIPIIEQEVNRTLTLLNDFSNLTKLKVERVELDATVLLHDVCESLSILIKAHNIVFDYSIFDDEVYLYGDYDRLKQVFINLIKNSIEAIPKGRNGLIKLKATKNNNNLVVRIEDNGIGIKKCMLKKMGEPFLTTKKGGTGLGVLLSKEIIEAHKGKIKYKSIENVKTVVTVTIPI